MILSCLARPLRVLFCQRSSHKEPQGRRRSLRGESLEDRRLLVAEGEIYSLSQVINTAGLTGALTSTVRWGDGSESAATVTALPATGPLRVRIDYSFDRGFFNTQARKDLLQLAADTLVSRFNDDLLAIVPSGTNTWSAVFTNPNDGSTASRENMVVAANEIVVFAGARDLAGNTRGFGGPGGFSSFGTPQWNDLVRGRGEPGAITSPQTDFGPWGGSITFDNGADSNWYFGTDPNGIQNNQVDFLTVATHELAHVLGFGFTPNSSVSSWENLTSTGSFSGPKAIAAYGAGGNVPLQVGETGHWQEGITSDGRETLMDPTILSGRRTYLSPLDFAALDDLGWDVDTSVVTVSATHAYADNGNFTVDVILRAGNGQLVKPVNAVITNVVPTLTVPANQSVVVGQRLTLTDIGQISDPGFANPLATPPTAETFSYSVDWGDQSTPTTGNATIDRAGNALLPTLASFDGSHDYQSEGTYIVTVRVSDDDNGVTQKTFNVIVTSPPELTLSLDQSSIAEDAGADAATLTVTRSGPTTSTPQTISLRSSDTSEATIPATITIAAGQTSATAAIRAIDDALLDGEQSVTLTASGTGVETATIGLNVTDRERITASFNVASIREDAAENSLVLTVSRSNTDTAAPININVTGGNVSQLVIPTPVVMAANQGSVLVRLTPVDDDVAELLTTLNFNFSSAGYQPTTATVSIIDDEPPKFQNPANRFNVNGDASGTTASDALEVINQLNLRGDNPLLDPATSSPNGLFVDVNGDYQVTALDALEIINELNRLSLASPTDAGGEQANDDGFAGRDAAITDLYAPAHQLGGSGPLLDSTTSLLDDKRGELKPAEALQSSQLF